MYRTVQTQVCVRSEERLAGPLASNASVRSPFGAELPRALAMCVALLFGAGCGFGTGGVLAAISGSGGGTNASAAPGPLSVLGAKTSPTTIRLVLNDPDGDPATVQFAFVAPGSPGVEVPLTQLQRNPVELATSRDGTVHLLPWAFASEPGLGNGVFVEGVALIARIQGGSVQSTAVGLGNDAPVVVVTPPDAEVTGVVPVRFGVRDSSDDAVNVRVEYFVASEPSAGWRLARPAGLLESEPTPEFAFRSVVAPRGGDQLVFFWDTNSVRGDLRQLERDVRLRFTPVDPVAAGAAVESSTFRVDNNEVPSLQLGEGALFLNPDTRRGIPISYTVRDAEGDVVRVLFQWRLETQAAFPDLGTTDPEELAQLVQDPRFVREKQICRPFPSWVRGHAIQVDATHVRLPELQQGASHRLAGSGLESRRLELLRPKPVSVLAGTWPSNPLTRPVAALPLGSGITALVLDAQGNGSRLLELDLATGGVVREIAAGPVGTPTTLAMDHDQRRALVGTELGGVWQLFEVELATGAVALRASGIASATGPQGELRALLPNGTNAALATADDAVWRIDWSTSPARVARLRGGLATPWGLVADPLRPGRVLVAERDADRVLTFDPITKAVEPVPISGMPHPTAMAITEVGTGPRLVALCDATSPSERVILGANLGRGAQSVFSLARVPAAATTLASGPADLLLAAMPQTGDLAAGGGIEQSRELVAYDPATAVAAVADAFAPPVRDVQAWRIAQCRPVFAEVRGTVAAASEVFLWDSRDAGPRAQVFLGATPMDVDAGVAVRTSLRLATDNLDVQGLSTGFIPTSAAAADLDGDGDLDLVCANFGGNSLSLFWQDSPGFFTGAPLLATSSGPVSVVAADLDGDGDLDLASVNRIANSLSLFLQDRPGVFTSAPPLATGVSPQAVVAADLDGDGDLDLVSANFTSNSLSLFFQHSPGVFTSSPPLMTTTGPSSVVASDLDGDGDLDLVSADYSGNSLSRFLQDSPGVFTSAPPLSTGLRPTSVVGADLDGDGDLDLVSSNEGSNSLLLFLQDSPGVFTSAPPLETGVSPNSVVAADLDGDGDLDLVSANRDGSSLSMFFQTAPGAFTRMDSLGAGVNPYAVVAADLDGDGNVDLVSVDFSSNSLSLFLRTAPGFFTIAPPLATGASPQSVAAADLDGDGGLDLVSANATSNSLSLLLQGAPRVFSSELPLATGQSPESVVAADLDGDGNLDLASATRLSNRLSLFRQDAPAVFTSVPQPSGTPGVILQPKSVTAADLDGDGDLDLVGVSTAPLLYLRLQDAPWSFTSAPSLTTGFSPQSVAAADLDGDGDLDLVSANSGSNSLSLFLQDAPGIFTSAPPLATGLSPQSVVAADLDGDGDLDLVSANSGSNSLSLFLQDAPGVFAVVPPLATGGAPQLVVAADLDGDGDLDLVSADSGSNSLSVFFGRGR